MCAKPNLPAREEAGAPIRWFWSTCLWGEGRALQARTTQASISLPSPNEAPQMALLMQQKLVFSQVCELEVQDQAVDSSELSRGLCLGSQMVIFPPCPHTAFLWQYTLSVSVPTSPALIRTSTHMVRPTSVTLF